jgi:PEP-CTERM motif
MALLGLVLGVAGAPAAADAAVCDLTVSGSTCAPFAGAIYSTDVPQPTGTGYIDPFLRLQHNGSEKGYNTSADYTPEGGFDFQTGYDQKDPLNYTHDLLLSAVPIVSKTVDGVTQDYREFLLDINEPDGPQALLSLDELQIFLSPVGMLGVQGESEYDPSGNAGMGTLDGLNAIYDLDTGGNNYIMLNYALASGSGSGDMVVYIPNSLFTQPGSPQYVYLYSQFGTSIYDPCNIGCKSGDGFEEWWVRVPNGTSTGQGSAVPEPGTLMLVGGGLMLLGRNLRRRPR